MPLVPAVRPSTPGLLLDLVRTAGTISRVELAQSTGLTAGTITHIVRKLIHGGLLHEVGRVQSARGTPRRLLQINPGAGAAVRVERDGSTPTVLLVDLAGLSLEAAALPGSGPD